MGGVVKLGKPKGRSPVSLWDLGRGQKGRRCGLKRSKYCRCLWQHRITPDYFYPSSDASNKYTWARGKTGRRRDKKSELVHWGALDWCSARYRLLLPPVAWLSQWNCVDLGMRQEREGAVKPLRQRSPAGSLSLTHRLRFLVALCEPDVWSVHCSYWVCADTHKCTLWASQCIPSQNKMIWAHIISDGLTSLYSPTWINVNVVTVVTLPWLYVKGRWPNGKLGFLKDKAKVSLCLNLFPGDLCPRRALVALMASGDFWHRWALVDLFFLWCRD